MNEQPPIIDSEPMSRREARRERREQRLAAPSQAGTWPVGVILIALGGLFLTRNTGNWDIPVSNWWALFILIPAVGAFIAAGRMYREAGNRLFPIIGIGATAGSPIGAGVAGTLFDAHVSAHLMLYIAAGLLLLTLVFYVVVNRGAAGPTGTAGAPAAKAALGSRNALLARLALPWVKSWPAVPRRSTWTRIRCSSPAMWERWRSGRM